MLPGKRFSASELYLTKRKGKGFNWQFLREKWTSVGKGHSCAKLVNLVKLVKLVSLFKLEKIISSRKKQVDSILEARGVRLLVGSPLYRYMKTVISMTNMNMIEIKSFGYIQNIARIANAVPVTLYSRVTVNVEIGVLNCQKCNQCLKGHKSLGLFFEG